MIAIPMDNFIIDVPVPSMGATVSELVVISLKVAPGDRVEKGQKLAELESEKSIFDYEAPGAGTIVALPAQAGQSLVPGALFLRLETNDASLRHLESKGAAAAPAATQPAAARVLVWTPKATKLAQEAGLDPAKLTEIGATGPGGRVSGDDVAAYLAKHKA
jgi:pyruvate/2-oxoglutarate dehydrogenase complex dihydrolipoamide acyltransferase (E2) component